MNMVHQNDKENNDKKDKGNEGSFLEQYYVPVQEYTGDEFELKGANPKTGEIAEANRDEVEEAVKDYFLQHYKTEVKVNNIVSAKDGVSVFVESLGNIEFYAMAIVPIDVQNNKVETENVWSLEGDVKRSITSALYVEAFREEFDKLGEVLYQIAEEHGLTGIKQEVVKKTKGNGYENTYYFVTSGFTSLNDLYYEDINVKSKDLKGFIRDKDFKLSEANGISIRLYIEEPDIEPTDDLLHEIYELLNETEGLPSGRYSILLNDNKIDIRDADGDKDNTLYSVFHREGEI